MTNDNTQFDIKLVEIPPEEPNPGDSHWIRDDAGFWLFVPIGETMPRRKDKVVVEFWSPKTTVPAQSGT